MRVRYIFFHKKSQTRIPFQKIS
nr:unnamed protein product [Callosobruchus analis]